MEVAESSLQKATLPLKGRISKQTATVLQPPTNKYLYFKYTPTRAPIT